MDGLIGNIGIEGLLVMGVVALMLFGPRELPRLTKQVGGVIKDVTKIKDDITETVTAEVTEISKDVTKIIEEEGLDKLK